MGAASIQLTLAELCQRVGGEIVGEGNVVISGIAGLAEAKAGDISFLTSAKYKKQLPSTRASAVILSSEFADQSPVAAWVVANPYLVYAKVAEILYPDPIEQPGVHGLAVVDEGADIHPSASVAPTAYVHSTARIGENASIGPGCIVGRDCVIDAHSRLVANVTLCKNVIIGQRCIIHPGAVLGSDGFGNAQDHGVWYKVPQLGGVKVGNDVEIGANTTIDCGAIGDTVVEDGVRLDNLIHIAHNVHIGAHTAIAGHTAVAGSTKIGKRCAIAGAVGISGHIEIADGVTITGMAMVTKSIRDPGVYSSGLPAEPNSDWHHTIVRIRQLEKLMERVKRLEKQLNIDMKGSDLG